MLSNSCKMRWLMLLLVSGQELCGQAPSVSIEKLGAGERQADPTKDWEGEAKRCRGRRGSGGPSRGRQPHQVRSMKQVCVFVFVSVGVPVCFSVCVLTVYFLLVFFLMCACVCFVLILCLYLNIILSSSNWVVFQPQNLPLLVSKKPAGINFLH